MRVSVRELYREIQLSSSTKTSDHWSYKDMNNLWFDDNISLTDSNECNKNKRGII